MQYNVGYVSCGLVVTHLLVNLALMLYSSARKMFFKIKKWIYLRQNKQAKLNKVDIVNLSTLADLNVGNLALKNKG